MGTDQSPGLVGQRTLQGLLSPAAAWRWPNRESL